MHANDAARAKAMEDSKAFAPMPSPLRFWPVALVYAPGLVIGLVVGLIARAFF
jgi:hypothetical protein